MIHRSPWPDVEIPDVPLTPFLLDRVPGRADRPALIDGPTGRSYTYGQWAGAVRRAAFGLAKRGFGKGDVLAIYSPNLPEYAIAFHAASLLGGIITTVNPLYTVEELTYQLQDSGATRLITVPAFLDKAQQAARAVGVREVFLFGEAEGTTPFAALLAEEGPLPDPRIRPREDVVVLPYSSGTTGLPKGVMLTHRNMVANVVQSATILTVQEGEAVVAVLPFFHIYGLTVVLSGGLYNGVRIVSMPRFELEPFLEILQKYEITLASLVPPIILALAKHPAVDKYHLKLRRISSGAAPLGGGVAEACSRRLGCPVVQGFGMTETSPTTHASPEDPARTRPASIGFPIANTESKIADIETGADLGPNQHGELCVRGPQVMKGYHNRPEATAAMIDAEGWLHTGDIGYTDEEGFFYVVDRLKELIKYKGMQVAPAELEGILLTHPAVADAAVIPSPDEEAGEVPKAFVVLKGQTTPEDVMAFVAARVAPHKKIRRLEVIEQIPKSPSGKILRRVLVARERAQTQAG